MGFLLSRRWVLFAVAVVFLAWVATQLGQWQFHRLDERKADNQIVATNLNAATGPRRRRALPRAPAGADDEWRRVTVHGTWDDEHTIVLKYQTRDGAGRRRRHSPGHRQRHGRAGRPGLDVHRQLRRHRPELPAVTDGRVTVTGGYARRDRQRHQGQRALDPGHLLGPDRRVLPYPLYGGFLDLAAESPAPAEPLEPVVLPDDTSNGPHFFYGLQWWFFGALAVFGFCYLVWDELRQRRGAKAEALTATGACLRPRAASCRR